MKRITLVLTALVLASGCTSTGPVTATSNAVSSRKGSACVKRVLNMIPVGDTNAGIYKAAKNGGISKISTVDYHNFGIPFLYQSQCTVVHGS